LTTQKNEACLYTSGTRGAVNNLERLEPDVQ